MRLQKIIADSGLASRRKAEEWIAEGKVTVNGTVTAQLGAMADPKRDVIKIGSRRLPPPQEKIYILFHKPAGCLTTLQDDRGRQTVMDFLAKVKFRVFPVGRLDYNTQGALLLTNDGELAKKLLDPHSGVQRTYLAKVRGVPDEKTLARMRRGVPLDHQPTRPMEVAVTRVSGKNCFLTLKLVEGKNRHIKRVCEKVRCPVIKLKRTHFAFLTLKGMLPGGFRNLRIKEVEDLRRLVGLE